MEKVLCWNSPSEIYQNLIKIIEFFIKNNLKKK